MSVARIERTSIWKKTLAEKTDGYQAEREELRAAFRSLRDNTNHLVTRISATLPDLTQHDITHLDVLWETASLIVGEDFELTPLEGFVLGCSFLLHDSALCFEAFEGGKEAIRDTTQWKDTYFALKDNDSSLNESIILNDADFITLRNLHAEQAGLLLAHEWKDPTSGSVIFLLDNQKLRTHLGKTIGQIASSHHWDIETIISTFRSQLNALPGFPTEWRIDPVKLALILRCADAAHLDGERAPDFLHALLKRSGVSLDHWVAQNRLSKVDIYQTDPTKSTLLFTSTIDFEESDSSAWFVAYDAIFLLDKEIKESNLVLEKRLNKTFQIKKIQGSESPEKLSLYVKANGWEPCSSRVHIGNIEKVIKNLGGEMLYGAGADNFGVVLREMIQNSRDAVSARRIFDDSFDGQISISIENENESLWLSVSDNGTGMSKRVMTGPLLDFGTSFWTSNLVQSEFPSLRSSKFKSVGKFGIGFYSLFMIADTVIVESRNYIDGLSEVHQLNFTNGFSLRPILKKGASDSFKTNISTRVKLKLKAEVLPKDLRVEIKNNKMGAVNFNVHVKDYIAAVCAGVDVNVFFTEPNVEKLLIHYDINSREFNRLEWLKRISFLKDQPGQIETAKYIEKNASRLKPVIESGVTLGLAAISTTRSENNENFLSLDCIGGLANTVHSRNGDEFIGYLDYTPKSAKRDANKFAASNETLKKWASDQLEELKSLNLEPSEKYIASSSLSKFLVDPSELAMILVSIEEQYQFLSFKELAKLSQKQGIAFLSSSIMSFEHIETHHRMSCLPSYCLVHPLSNSSFLSLKMESGVPKVKFSILDCLYRAILADKKTPVFNVMESAGFNVFQNPMNALIVTAE